MKTYTTKQGDKWDGIAYTQLGDILELPDVTISVADAHALPPWKRVST